MYIVDWDKYHILINKAGGLFIGRGKRKRNGEFAVEYRSDDRTEEIVKMVCVKMNRDLEEREDNRPYVGYKIPYFGTLIFLRKGYTFAVRKK